MAATSSPPQLRSTYTVNSFGYREFGVHFKGAPTDRDYACRQHASAEGATVGYLPALLGNARTVLDVGCGTGAVVVALVEHGYDAYGVDLPSQAPDWADAKYDPSRFFCADATMLPFEDNSFDAVFSFGVIEHVGTTNGHGTLRPDYQEHRRAYAAEILRVTRPGGAILISCPNKTFPIDMAHSPEDMSGLRGAIFRKTGMNIHQTWGVYHLLSYSEVRKLFPGVTRSEPGSLKGMFEFQRVGRIPLLGPMLRKMARTWVEEMPAWVAGSFLNPWVLLKMEK